MKTEITEAIKTAEWDETMVFGRATMELDLDWDNDLVKAALAAKNRADRTGEPRHAYSAKLACAAWIEANQAGAMQVINRRIRARAAQAERDARPLTAAEADKILGM